MQKKKAHRFLSIKIRSWIKNKCAKQKLIMIPNFYLQSSNHQLTIQSCWKPPL